MWLKELLLIMGLFQTIHLYKVTNETTKSDGSKIKLKNGALFLPQGKMILSSTHVIVPVSLSTKMLENGFLQTMEAVQNIQEEARKLNQSRHNSFLKDLDTLKGEISMEFKNVLQYLNGLRIKLDGNRSKRGALNIAGSLAKVLFGVATDKQIQKVTEALKNVENVSKQNLQRLNIVLTALKLEDERVSKLRTSQIKINNAVSKLFGKLVNVTSAIGLLDQTIELDHEFDTVSVSFLDYRLNVIDTLNGIKNMVAGTIDNRIIPDKFLLHLLNDIKLAGHKLVLPDDLYHIFYYEKIIKVGSMYNNHLDSLVFYLSVPTFASRGIPTFDLFRVITFPTPVHNTTNTVLHYKNVPNYLAASEFYFVELESISQCVVVQEIHFCELTSSIQSFKDSKSCPASLFKDQNPTLNYCSHTFGNGAQNQILKVQNEFYYYVNESITIEFVCKNAGLDRNVKLTGMGIVTMAAECEGFGPGIMLPASVATFTQPYELVDFLQPMNFNVRIFNTSRLPIDNFAKIDKITESLSGEIDIQSLLNMYDEIPNNSIMSSYSSVGPALNMVVALIFIIGGIIYYVNKKKLREEAQEEPEFYSIPALPGNFVTGPGGAVGPPSTWIGPPPYVNAPVFPPSPKEVDIIDGRCNKIVRSGNDIYLQMSLSGADVTVEHSDDE